VTSALMAVGGNFCVLYLLFVVNKCRISIKKLHRKFIYLFVRKIIAKFRSEISSDWEVNRTGPTLISVADFDI
jgi:hypothetical protein